MPGPTQEGEDEEEHPEAVEDHEQEAQLVEGHAGDPVQHVAHNAGGVRSHQAGGSLRTGARPNQSTAYLKFDGLPKFVTLTLVTNGRNGG